LCRAAVRKSWRGLSMGWINMALAYAISLISGASQRAALVRTPAGAVVVMAVALVSRGSHDNLYSILWVVVFGFATLNILGLAARHMEPTRRGLSFGELMAVMVVLMSIFLLGWEMLSLLHIFPIRIRR
jgi:hypothetical protein